MTLSSVATRLPDEKPSTVTTHLKIIEICNIFHGSNSAQGTVSIHLRLCQEFTSIVLCNKGEVSDNLPMQERNLIVTDNMTKINIH